MRQLFGSHHGEDIVEAIVVQVEESLTGLREAEDWAQDAHAPRRWKNRKGNAEHSGVRSRATQAHRGVSRGNNYSSISTVKLKKERTAHRIWELFSQIEHIFTLCQ